MAQPAPQSQSEMRQRNLSRVLHALASEGPLSRAEVATRIGLTRAAVSTLVDELLRGGLLVERGPGRSGAVGRPGTQLVLTDRGPCGVGAEIGVDHLAVAVMDLRGRVRVRLGREVRNQGSEPAAVLATLSGMLRAAVRDAAGAGLRPAGLTVAVPGLLARDPAADRARLLMAPNLGWRDTDLAAGLPGDLGPVTVENEANLGALAELWSASAAQGLDSFVHVSAEIGIGAAVVVEGRLLRGAHGFAGELGHVPVRPEGRPCSCGGRGCLEAYAGEEAVLRAAGLEPGPGVRLGALTARCEAGDAGALRAVRQAGTALGIALSGTVNLLDPRQVVIGGSLAMLAPWLLPPVNRELARRTSVAAGGRATPVPVTASPLGPDGPLLGAAGFTVRAALDEPARLLRA
ncbi:ROK family transcriptional regulator [Streptomyces millisiae]|uniref:ROK family transcriptional regulator n=1 Tax=Streptomyces millisiae TaxID=3075542 RepID=A0ABU2LXX4_9ACTN|nr:ROK family transcriptional regulator [Streptomyces sp. DSM 44918]MDT0322449.1 ROK family transcriptional regulator [Streptomyces sp. DSM 44918]